MSSPDSVLWTSFLAGDERASDQLFLAHFEGLYRYGLRLTNDEDLTKDGIQNMFQQLWQRRGALGPVAAVRPYLLTALRRQLARDQQTQHRQRRLDGDYEAEFDVRYLPTDFGADDPPDAERHRQLLAALARLSSRQREVMYLKFFDGFGYERIAEIMDLNVQSARNLVHQSLKLLKQRLGPACWLLLGKSCLFMANI